MTSSILFVALVGAWLCYFVPGWLARRHEAAQSNLTEERDSESMRVLPARARRSNRHGGGHVAPAEAPLADYPAAPLARPGRAGSLLLATCLVASLIAAPVLVGLAFLGTLGWVPALVTVLSTGALLGLLRARVVLAAGRGRSDRVEDLPEQVAVEVLEPTSVEPLTVLHDEDAVRAVERAAAVAAARADAIAKEKARAELVANLKPGEWLPTEVPKPAYLLKPQAPARAVVRTEIDLRETQIDLREPVVSDEIDLRQRRAPRAS